MLKTLIRGMYGEQKLNLACHIAIWNSIQSAVYYCMHSCIVLIFIDFLFVHIYMDRCSDYTPTKEHHARAIKMYAN